MHILAPSMLAICICAVCLCGASWAWFTASTSTGTTTIQSSSYKLLYQVGEDTASTELGEAGTAYTLTADTRVIKLKAPEHRVQPAIAVFKSVTKSITPSRFL